MINDSENCKLEEKHDETNQQDLLESTVNNFCAMMEESGPVVRALLLKADGAVVEVNYDSTPRNDHISTILGGCPTIVGELPGKLDGVILTKKYTPDPLVDLPNQHSILAPYGLVLGDVFVTRLDENVQPQHFGLLEWDAYMSSKDCLSAPETMTEFKDGESEDDNVEGCDEDEEEEVDPENAVMHAVVNAFMAKNGGAVPTAEQVADILDQMGFNVVDNLTDEEEREYLIEAFEAEHGVKPTAEQLEHLMKKLPLTKSAQLMSMDYPEDDDDEDYVPSDQDEQQNAMDELLAQAQSMVMDFPKMVLPGDSKPDHNIQNGKESEKLTHDIELEAHGNEKKIVDDLDGAAQVLKSG